MLNYYSVHVHSSSLHFICEQSRRILKVAGASQVVRVLLDTEKQCPATFHTFYISSSDM